MSSARTGPSCRPTEPSTRRATVKKPCESLPRPEENHEPETRQTSGRKDSSNHPPQVRTVRGPLQRVREGRGGPRHLRIANERGPAEVESRVLFLPLGFHGGQRRGWPSARLHPLPPHRESARHLPGRD